MPLGEPDDVEQVSTVADGRLFSLEVENFRSLRKVTLPLGPVNVLVGPNGAGKTNVLEVFRFLADIVHTDLVPALDQRGGFDRLVFHGGSTEAGHIRIGIKGSWLSEPGPRQDAYELRIFGAPFSRQELFTSGTDHDHMLMVTVSGTAAAARLPTDPSRPAGASQVLGTIALQDLSSGLSTLPRLGDETFGPVTAEVAGLLRSFRIFEVDVQAAMRPTRAPIRIGEGIASDASNLSTFLLWLSVNEPDAWQRLQADAIEVLPQLDAIEFEHAGPTVLGMLHERGLREPTPLQDASYGTIRLLGLLAMLHDPRPPALTCVEEIDHGLHPQALELLVERVRDASERTQFIIATHSPALADRLRPEELIVCERSEDGSSLIPAISREKVEKIVRASEGLPLGELWFSGALGGDL